MVTSSFYQLSKFMYILLSKIVQSKVEESEDDDDDDDEDELLFSPFEVQSR